MMSADNGIDQLKAVLAEVDFPAAKETIVDRVADSGADEDVLRAVRSMPPVQYEQSDDVLRSVPLSEETSDARSDSQRAQQRRQNTRDGLAETMTETGPVNPIEEELGENRKS